MAGFVRRFTIFPDIQTLTSIEGVVIVDLIPPGVFVGRVTGTVCLVGEWPKGPNDTPTLVEGERTIDDVFGGFSLSVTDPLSYSTNPFSNGNGFCWLKSKRYRRLVLVRADLSLAEGCNVQLFSALGQSAVGSINTDNAGTAVTPADTETFILDDGTNPAVTFEFDTNGSVVETNTLRQVDISAATDSVDVKNAIITAVQNAPVLNITALDGGGNIVTLQQDFNGTAGNTAITETVASALFVATAFSGGTGATRASTVLAQDVTIPGGTRVYDASAPTVEFGLAQDVVIAAGTNIGVAGSTVFALATASYTTRTVSDVPVFSTQGVGEAAVGNVDTANVEDLFRGDIGPGSANPNLRVSASTGAGLDTAPANAAALAVLSSATIDTRYSNAIDSTLPGDDASDFIEIMGSARQSAAIRTKLFENARDASQVGTGRVALVRASVGTLPANARGATDPGVGANRSDRIIYCYPHYEQRIEDIQELDPNAVISSQDILLGADAAMGTILSQLPPEENPGQSTQDIITGGMLSFIRKLEDGLTGTGLPTKFGLTDYQLFKSSGIAALRRDPRISEWIFQSGVTSVDPSLFPSLAPIKRRRMSDFIQDSMASVALKFVKKLATTERYNALVGEETDFLDGLLSETNPAQQRIAAFSIDPVSGNSTTLQGSGVRVIVVEVQLLDSLDVIVLQTTIGEGVEITETTP